LGFCERKNRTRRNSTSNSCKGNKRRNWISDLEFVEGFEEKINYNFQFEGELIQKEVVFFLAKTKTPTVNVSHEHLDYTWLDYENALEKVTYQNAKNILSKANKLFRNT